MFPKSVLPLILTPCLLGCALFGPSTKPPEQRELKVGYTLPVVKPVEGTQELQDRNGVMISVSSAPFVPRKTIGATYKQLPTSFVMNDQYNYEVISTPRYSVSPDNVRFKVKVVNNLNQVVRLAGTVVRFNVDGKEVTLDPKTSGSESFGNAILTPREQKEFDILGPRTLELPNDATLGLMLYGVVTQTDDAGNPTKRSNYEWFYKVGREDVVKSETYEIATVKMRPSDVPKELTAE
jgi:hypothetical protein